MEFRLWELKDHIHLFWGVGVGILRLSRKGHYESLQTLSATLKRCPPGRCNLKDTQLRMVLYLEEHPFSQARRISTSTRPLALPRPLLPAQTAEQYTLSCSA